MPSIGNSEIVCLEWFEGRKLVKRLQLNKKTGMDVLGIEITYTFIKLVALVISVFLAVLMDISN